MTRFGEIWRNLTNFRRNIKFHRLKTSSLPCDSSLKTRSSLDDIRESVDTHTDRANTRMHTNTLNKMHTKLTNRHEQIQTHANAMTKRLILPSILML